MNRHFFLLLLFPLLINAQSTKESRETDSLKIAFLSERLSNEIRSKQFEKAKLTIDTISVLAQKNNLVKKIGDCYFNYGLINRLEGNQNALIENLQRSLDYYLPEQEWASASKAYTAIAQSLLTQEKYEAARENFLLSLNLRKRTNDSLGMANNLFNLGSISYQQGAFSDASDYYHQALKIASNIKNKNLEASILVNLSNVYNKLKSFDQSIDMLNQALAIYSRGTDRKGESNTLMSLGIFFYEKGDYVQAENHLKKALEIKTGLKDDEAGLSKTYNNLGLVAKAKGDTAKSLEYYNLALELAKKINDRHLEASILNNIGSRKLEQRKTESVELILESLEKAKELGMKNLILVNYDNLQQYYAQEGDYKQAFHYGLLYQELNQSLFNEQIAEKILELQAQYETEKKQAEIELLIKEAQIQNLTLARSRMHTYVGIAFSLMLLITVAVLYSRFILKKRVNLQLQEINHTKDRFFTIIAHDLKNTLSAFKNISGSLRKKMPALSHDQIEPFIETLDESAKSLNELFQNLLQWSQTQTGVLTLKPGIIETEKILQKLISSFEPEIQRKSIILDLDIQENLLPFVSDEHIISTVLRNLISNSIKFTKEQGSINIQVQRENNHILFSIKDQGPGIDHEDLKKLFRIEHDAKKIGVHENKGSGLGLILCKELLDVAGGHIGVESEMGIGSRFYFTIPIKNQDND